MFIFSISKLEHQVKGLTKYKNMRLFYSWDVYC